MSFPGEYFGRQVAPDGREVALAAETVPRIYGCRTLAHVRARMVPGVPYLVARYRNGGGVDVIAPDGSILADGSHLRPNPSGGGWHAVYPVHYAEADA